MTLLRLLPPEAAHKAALFAVKNGLGPRGTPSAPNESITLFGKTFQNRIGLAAGADKKAEALSGWSRMGFGFVEAGSVARYLRRGNPSPRLWRIAGNSLINWIGLPGEGVDPFARNLRAFSDRKGLIVGASLVSPENSAEDIKAVAAAVAPHVDYMTLNISCPNVDSHVAAPDMALLKAAVGEAGGKPVLVKLEPTHHEASLAAAVKRAMETGAGGIVAANTVSFNNRHLLSAPPEWPQYNGAPVGGYSGPGLLDISCWMVKNIRMIVGKDIPVMGCGGVQSGANAMRLLDAGADVIQLYTGLVYKGPTLLNEIRQACSLLPQQDRSPR